MMKKTAGRPAVRVLAFVFAALMLLTHSALLSACTASAKSAEPVEIAEPVLAAAFRHYFGLKEDEPLTADLLAHVESIEITPSARVYSALTVNSTDLPFVPEGIAFTDTDGNVLFYPMRVLINEGRFWDGEKVTDEVYSFGFEALPAVIDRPLFYELTEKIRAYGENGEWNMNKFNSFYTLKDGTEEACDAMAQSQVLYELKEEGKINSADMTVTIQPDGSALIGSSFVLPADEYEQRVAVAKGRYKAELLSLFPFADRRPMFICDPDAKPRENTELMRILYEAGALEGRVLTEPAISVADLEKCPNLKTVTVDPYITTK